MSQRNPMNDRYQTDERKGQTRKSAASAKPKTKAASSVRVQKATKTPQEKKAAKKAQKRQQREQEAKYYTPKDNPEYKKWRKVWWIMLIGAIVMTAASFIVRSIWPEQEIASLIVLGVGYVGIIGALVIDFWKIRKIRQQYQAEMQGKITKEERAAEKEAHAAKLAAKKAAEEAEKAKQEQEQDKGPIEVVPKKGLFSFTGLRSTAQRASQANKAAAREAAAAQSAATDGDEVTQGTKKSSGSNSKGK